MLLSFPKNGILISAWSEKCGEAHFHDFPHSTLQIKVKLRVFKRLQKQFCIFWMQYRISKKLQLRDYIPVSGIIVLTSVNRSSQIWTIRYVCLSNFSIAIFNHSKQYFKEWLVASKFFTIVFLFSDMHSFYLSVFSSKHVLNSWIDKFGSFPETATTSATVTNGLSHNVIYYFSGTQKDQTYWGGRFMPWEFRHWPDFFATAFVWAIEGSICSMSKITVLSPVSSLSWVVSKQLNW